MQRPQSWKIPLLLFVVGLLGYGLVAGERLTKQSSDPHFVYQADAWLHGQLAITPPTKGDDWAKVETVTTKTGVVAQGRRLASRPYFRTLEGREIPTSELAPGSQVTHYNSFPPFPSLLFLPQAAISGRAANDTFPTVFLAALILPLGFLMLQRLAAAGLSSRSQNENIWLSVALGFGTVLYFCAVQGRVWYTAHVVGVVLCLAYLTFSIEAKRPFWAGLAFACAAVTRTPMAFMFPLFLFEVWRTLGPDRKAMARKLAWFAGPVIVIAVAAAALNYARFHSLGEFGHSYLAVRQQKQMEAMGLFDWNYFGRNLTVALTLLPTITPNPPYLAISGHGIALWLTTPIFLLLLWPGPKQALTRPLAITALCVALPSLFYQNSGFFQFGYRFSLDYTVFLIAMWAVCARPLSRTPKILIVLAIAINLFGAITFTRYPKFYRADGNAYNNIVQH